MVTIGVDSHKRTHTFVAVDDVGAQLGVKTVPATTEGHLAGLEWAERWPARRWAVEDCRPLTRRLESDLLAGAEKVVRVPPQLMAGERRGGRQRGKSDPIDALAVARAALREPDLPVACLDGPARDLKLLVDHREDLVRDRVRAQARLRWHLHELLPTLAIPPRKITTRRMFDTLEEHLNPLQGTLARIARELLDAIRALTTHINRLTREITALVTPLAPTLLALPGCGPLSAAKIIGETAGITRFKSAAAYARWNGTAPIPAWSASPRYRLNRGGNRQVNTALHRIAITQIAHDTPGRTYLQTRLTHHDTPTEAIRKLRRRLSDQVFRRLHTDHQHQHPHQTQTTAA